MFNKKGDAMVCWCDTRDDNSEIYFSIIKNFENQIKDKRLTYSNGESIGVSIHFVNNRWIIVFNDNSIGNHEIYMASVDQEGMQKSIHRISWADNGSLIPCIGSRDNLIGVAWNDFRNASGPNDYSRSDIYFATFLYESIME